MDPSVDEDDMRVDEGLLVSQGGLVAPAGAAGVAGAGGPPVEGMDQERRIRREIANSNERRRMQSINAGFQSLRTLLPHHEGEKLSKAAILQQTAEYIYTLEQEKTLLLSQNSQLKRLLSLNQQRLEGGDLDTSPQMKKKRYAAAATSDTSSSSSGADTVTTSRADIKAEFMTDVSGGNADVETGTVTDINLQLMQEQRLRLRLEERVKSLERQLSMSSTQSGGVGNVVSTGNGTTITLPSKPEPPKNLTMLATTTTATAQQAPEHRGEPHRATTARILPVTATNPSGATAILLQPPVPQQPQQVVPQTVEAASTVPAAPTATVPASVLQAAVAASKKETEPAAAAAVAVSRQPSGPPAPQPVSRQPSGPPAPQPVSRHTVEVVERISSLQPQPPTAPQPVLPSMPLPLAAAVKAADSSELVIRSDQMDGVERSYTVTTAAGNNSRQNLDSIVEAIRHLEGDHLFSEDRVVKEEVVDYSTANSEQTITTIQVPTNSSKAAASVLASIQLPQEPVSISSATIARTVAVGSSNTGGVIIIKQP